MPTVTVDQEKTGLGNYFIANYPPFSFWKPNYLPDAMAVLDRAPTPGTPLGLYLHIPFCRKRCKFCYFRVFTEMDAARINRYLDAVVREVEAYAALPATGARPLSFVYFGGGTPSLLSVHQLNGLFNRLRRVMPWDCAEEITFECEPGTLTEHKLKAIRKMGVTRLSLGVENFDDRILEINGRAHRSPEIETAYRFGGWFQVIWVAPSRWKSDAPYDFCSPECLNSRLAHPPTPEQVLAMRHGAGGDREGANPAMWPHTDAAAR